MAKLKGNAQAVYNSGGQTLSDGAETGLFVDSTGALITTATLSGDVEIGAVEIKNSTDDTRATVTANGLQVEAVGNVASGATDSGNPQKVAGKYNATMPTFTDGQRGDLQVSNRGVLKVTNYLNDSATVLAYSADNADAVAASSTASRQQVISRQTVSVGANWDRLRTPNIFKTATATASGDTAVWTPTSSTKFRLMRFSIQITADAATSGGAVIDIVLRDSTTGLAPSLSVFVPAVAGTTFGNTTSTGWCDLGNGILSAAANNVLNVNLSAALTAGKVRVIACGTEE